jgi:hypothetical protein
MRKITADDADKQVQESGDGTQYHYRKDYIYKGDMKEEYTLVLLWAKKGKTDAGLSGNSGETVCPGTGPVLPIPGQPENT